LLQEIILFLHYYPHYTHARAHTHTFRKRKRQEKLLENSSPNMTLWKSLKPFFLLELCFRAFE
jgi:hypothetical protein